MNVKEGIAADNIMCHVSYTWSIGTTFQQQQQAVFEHVVSQLSDASSLRLLLQG